jgi:hypothetical protein
MRAILFVISLLVGVPVLTSLSWSISWLRLRSAGH